MSNVDALTVALRFNEGINARDLEALAVLMPPNHLFVDSAGSETRGSHAMRAAWSKFFQAFPDYRNVITSCACDGANAYLFGHSECSEPALAGPAMWTAVVLDGLVSEWRVEDADETKRRARLGLEATPGVTPYLYYEDAGAALDWLSRVYGFSERPHETIRTESGVVHACVSTGRGLVFIGHPGSGYENPSRLGQATQSVYVYVSELTQHYERARREGATILSPPEDTFYGDRRYGSADLEGHQWFFAEKIRNVAAKDWHPQSGDLEGHR